MIVYLAERHTILHIAGKSGNPEPFAKGLDDPKGLAASKNALFVAYLGTMMIMK